MRVASVGPATDLARGGWRAGASPNRVVPRATRHPITFPVATERLYAPSRSTAHTSALRKTKEFRNRTMKGTRARQYRSVPVMMVSRTAQPASPRDRIPGRAGAGSPLEAKSPRRVSRPRAGGAGIKTGCFPRKYILRSNYPRTSSRESSTAPLGHLLYPGSRIPRGRAAAARRLLRHEGDWRTHRTDQGSRPCRASRTSSASTKQGKEEPLGTPVGNICGSDGGCRQRE